MKKLITTILATIAAAITTHAQTTNNFTGATAGQWNVSTNWSQGTVPTSSQNVFSTNNTEVRIGSTTAALADNLTIGGASGTSIVALRNDSANSLTVSGNITLAPGAGAGQLSLGTGAGFTSTLTIGGGSGSILDGGGAGLSRIAIFGHMGTLGLLAVTADDLNINQNSSGSLTIGPGQTFTIGTTRVGSGTTNVTDALTVKGTLLSTIINPGANNVNGTNNATFTLDTGGLLQATTLRRSGSQNTTFNWNDGTIQNKSGGNLTVDATSGTLIISLADTGTHIFEADSGRTITVASTAILANKTGENGTLTKTGAGLLALNNANTYTGTTTVNAGTLLVNGSLLSSNTIVSTGATLGGSGLLQSVTLNGGTVAPGNSPGLLTVANLDASNGNFAFEIGAPNIRGVTYDAINATSLLTLGSNTTWNFSVIGNYNFQLNDTYDLFDWGTLDASTFESSTLLAALPDLDTVNSQLQWSVESFGVDGTVSVIPEPSTLDLLSLPFKLLIQACKTLNCTQIYNIVSHVNTNKFILAQGR